MQTTAKKLVQNRTSPPEPFNQKPTAADRSWTHPPKALIPAIILAAFLHTGTTKGTAETTADDNSLKALIHRTTQACLERCLTSPQTRKTTKSSLDPFISRGVWFKVNLMPKEEKLDNLKVIVSNVIYQQGKTPHQLEVEAIGFITGITETDPLTIFSKFTRFHLTFTIVPDPKELPETLHYITKNEQGVASRYALRLDDVRIAELNPEKDAKLIQNCQAIFTSGHPKNFQQELTKYWKYIAPELR
jgi:hypothetical protein